MYTDHSLTRTIQPTGLDLPNDILRNITRYLAGSFMIPTAKRNMSTVAQRNNLVMLADQVLAYQVEGDLVEFGCHTGSTAQAIALANQQHGGKRNFHVYDDFQFDPQGTGKVKQTFCDGFAKEGLALPEIHEGEIFTALLHQLPERIAFAHIDLGFEEEPRQVTKMVLRCLEAIYPLMSPGAVCVLMDYHDPIRTVKGWDCSPGVKIACDQFLREKKEYMNILFGEEYSHAFFRKEIPI